MSDEPSAEERPLAAPGCSPEPQSPIVTTIPEKCRHCYSCVRRCPAKAIRVQAGRAQVIAERCIACGRCVRVCSQNAKQLQSGVPLAKHWIAQKNAVLLLAPSFPAAFSPRWSPGQILAACRRLGFQSVHEVAFGADLVSRQYKILYSKDPTRLTITTPCPAAVLYIQKYASELLPYLAPILSPMAALGKALKQRLRPGCRTIFAGPCVSKILEARDPEVSPWIDAVLPFTDLLTLLTEAQIDPSSLAEEDFDPPFALDGGIYPVPGGIVRAAGLPADLLSNDVYHVTGVESFVDCVERLARRVQAKALDTQQTRLFDVLFCKGCLAGPGIPGNGSLLLRKERVVAYVRSSRQRRSAPEWQAAMAALADLDLSRRYLPDLQRRPDPTEQQIREILARTNKVRPEDELNCRACGYRSCRDKAIAVYHGLAEVEMCLPYLIDKLEATVGKLNRSHQELQEAQSQLIRSERLASMGQLAAGIAHEVNNPLGTILIYAHLVSETLSEAEKLRPEEIRDDIQMILDEATRCKTIVGGLLDFARQNKVKRTLVDVPSLLEDVLRLSRAHARSELVQFELAISGPIPSVMLDRDQMLQALLNLTKNAVESMPQGGTVTLRAQWLEEKRELKLAIEDTGPGIAPEHMTKLFSPFFTTKPVGQGTGLGLPICYGIVKMHRGTISVRNRAQGPGALFEICLPCSTEELTHDGG